jgi:hypothetical protein
MNKSSFHTLCSVAKMRRTQNMQVTILKVQQLEERRLNQLNLASFD